MDTLAAAVWCRRLAVLTAVLAALVLAAGGGAATGPTPAQHGIAGSVPATAPGPGKHLASGPATPVPTATTDALREAGKAGTGGNLIWHGGPVMHANTTYAIYWAPPSQPMPAGYESTIDQFLGDVAHDSGGGENVYSATPQYTDSGGGADYASTFGGSWEDTSTPIPNHCASQYGKAYSLAGCVLDSDLQAEVARAISANGWTAGPSAVFFVFTPPAVGSCADTTSRDCAYRTYCAYHSYFTQGGTSVLYANAPYSDASAAGAPGVCDSGNQPNGNWADETINLVSHEHNEAVTDPLINAWYDASGNENGDKCVWNFGPALGGTAGSGATEGTQWNQLINGHHYYLQQEWSNAAGGCVLRTGAAAPAPAISGFSPGSGAPGTDVTIAGSHLTGATAVSFNGTAATFHVVDDGTISASVPAAATSGPISVTTAGGTAASAASFEVAAPAAPDFTISVSAEQTVTRGHNATYTVTIERQNGFSSPVALSAALSPPAAKLPTAAFSPRKIGSGRTTSTMTVKTRKATTTGTYTITVTGTSTRGGAAVHSATTTVTVQ